MRVLPTKEGAEQFFDFEHWLLPVKRWNNTSVCQLPEAQLHFQKRYLPNIPHWRSFWWHWWGLIHQNPRSSEQIFTSCSKRDQSPQNGIYNTSGALSIQSNAIWVIRSLCHISIEWWTPFYMGCESSLPHTWMIIIIFSPSWEEHLLHLRTVLQWLQEAKLTLNPRSVISAWTLEPTPLPCCWEWKCMPWSSQTDRRCISTTQTCIPRSGQLLQEIHP